MIYLFSRTEFAVSELAHETVKNVLLTMRFYCNKLNFPLSMSGDETTFKLFRTQAPELVHLPDATYEWYAQNYLDRYYPVRFILRMNGVVFPELTQKEE